MVLDMGFAALGAKPRVARRHDSREGVNAPKRRIHREAEDDHGVRIPCLLWARGAHCAD